MRPSPAVAWNRAHAVVGLFALTVLALMARLLLMRSGLFPA